MKEQHETFYLVWRQSGEAPRCKHPSQAPAEKEAERLARQNPGCTFHVLVSIGSVKTTDLTWTRF